MDSLRHPAKSLTLGTSSQAASSTEQRIPSSSPTRPRHGVPVGKLQHQRPRGENHGNSQSINQPGYSKVSHTIRTHIPHLVAPTGVASRCQYNKLPRFSTRRQQSQPGERITTQFQQSGPTTNSPLVVPFKIKQLLCAIRSSH